MKKFTIHIPVLTLLLGSLSYSGVALAKNKIKVYKVCQAKAGHSLKLYKDPTKHSQVLTILPQNTSWISKRKGKKKYSHSQWQKVTWNNKTGWLRNSCLKLDSEKTKIVARKPSCLIKKTRTKDCS